MPRGLDGNSVSPQGQEHKIKGGGFESDYGESNLEEAELEVPVRF